MQIGGNWANTLQQRLETAKVIIVVIGPKWVYSQFKFTDEAKGIYEGSRRIDHPEDPSQEIWYPSLEGPEAAAYERGTGELVDGEAFIPFSDHYE